MDVASSCFLAAGLVVIGLNLVVIFFFSMIYVPKIKKDIEDLLGTMTQNWIELQILTAFAYVQVGLTSDTKDMLAANDKWVFFNFFDQFCESVLQNNSADSEWDEWSESAFKNVFTVTLFIIAYLLLYMVFKLVLKNSTFTEFLQFEIGLVLMKIAFFRVSLSLFLEIYHLYNGGTADYNTGIISFYGLFFIVIYPALKIIFLRMKFRGNLNASRALQLFGSDFRSYKTCWREFHILTEQFLQLIIAGSLAFLIEQKEPQIFAMTGGLCVYLAYSIFFSPLRYRRLNIESWYSKGLLCGIIGIILGSHYYSDTDFLDYGVVIGLSLWYLGKLVFTFMHFHVAFDAVKDVMDKEPAPDTYSPSLLKEKKIIEKNKGDGENYLEDNTIITGRNIDKDDMEIQRDMTGGSAKKRIKRGITIESTPDSIDPRLGRKRSTRKRKTVTKVDS